MWYEQNIVLILLTTPYNSQYYVDFVRNDKSLNLNKFSEWSSVYAGDLKFD